MMVTMNKVSKVFMVASLLLVGSQSVYAMFQDVQDDDWKARAVFNGTDEELLALIKNQEENTKVKHKRKILLMPTNNPIFFLDEDDGPLTITTDNNAEASYQAESKRFFVKEGDILNIPYKITVTAGGIMSFGLLNTHRNNWYGDECVLREGEHEGVYTRIVPASETETSLVFRNYHLVSNGGPGQSIFTIEACDIQKEEKFQSSPKHTPEPAEEKKQIPCPEIDADTVLGTFLVNDLFEDELKFEKWACINSGPLSSSFAGLKKLDVIKQSEYAEKITEKMVKDNAQVIEAGTAANLKLLVDLDPFKGQYMATYTLMATKKPDGDISVTTELPMFVVRQ